MANPISSTRHLAHRLRNDPQITPNDCRAAAAAIDALLDAIEAGGMVRPRQALQMDLGPLMELRAFHNAEVLRAIGDRRIAAERVHRHMLNALNQYFPKDNQL